MVKKFNDFINEGYMNAERMIVINKILDGGKLSRLDKSLMTKLTQDLTIGQLEEDEQELYYELLRGEKQNKKERMKLWNIG